MPEHEPQPAPELSRYDSLAERFGRESRLAIVRFTGGFAIGVAFGNLEVGLALGGAAAVGCFATEHRFPG